MPTPPPTRIARRPGGRRREAPAERPERPQPLARARARTAAACPGRRPRAGSGSSPSRRRATEKARGRYGRSSSPPPQRSAAASIANWPGSGSRPVGVGGAQHAVGAEPLDAGDLRARRPNGARLTPRGRRRGWPGRRRAPGAAPWSSCRQSTSGSPSRRALAIARAAETAGGERRQARDPVRDGRAADLPAVGAGAERRWAC